MGGEDFLIDLALRGGPIGIVIVLLVTVGGYLLRRSGLTIFGDKSKVVATDDLSRIEKRLHQLDDRVRDIEHDLENRPTREDIHRLEIGLTRLEGRHDTLNSLLVAIGSAVTRMEDFMINQGQKGKG